MEVLNLLHWFAWSAKLCSLDMVFITHLFMDTMPYKSYLWWDIGEEMNVQEELNHKLHMDPYSSW